jgi:hypothetical protein
LIEEGQIGNTVFQLPTKTIVYKLHYYFSSVLTIEPANNGYSGGHRSWSDPAGL